MIRKVIIQNYRLFRDFELEFEPGMNIIVGDNDSGKSTLIEAINLALTGRIQGRWLWQDFSPFIVNAEATKEYINELNAAEGPPPPPPEVIIEVFFSDDSGAEILRGTNNLRQEDACGVRLRCALSPEYLDEYRSFASDPTQVKLAPTEYYEVKWLGFSDSAVTSRSIPTTASVIDPTAIRLQSGADYQLQQIIRTHLDPKDRVELSRQYRSLREKFSENDKVIDVNKRLAGAKGDISDHDLTLSVDISQRFTWENSLTAHLDDLPFQFIGKGEQHSVKTLLAIGRKAKDAHIVLLEEPENHLSFSSLRSLIARIEDHCEGKQVITATHSSFVLNRLGLERLILLGGGAAMKLTELPDDTVSYFKRLSGYDTLRLVLAKRVILVEGPSDDLVVQRAYMDLHGKLPIEEGIDVISVGLSFARFLDIAKRLEVRTSMITDNDGKDPNAVEARYSEFAVEPTITVHVGQDDNLRTLEPQLLAVNDLVTLNAIFGKEYDSDEELLEFMADNKTACALAIFETDQSVKMPKYILDALTE